MNWWSDSSKQLKICLESKETKNAYGIITKSYANQSEDIDDLFDQMGIVNQYIFNDNTPSELLQLRQFIKDKVREKYFDCKYNDRKYVNYLDSPKQYMDGMKYCWVPSETKIKEMKLK